MNDELRLAALEKQIDRTRRVFIAHKEINPRQAEKIVRSAAHSCSLFSNDLGAQRDFWRAAEQQLRDLKPP
jgi:hypothetical protein